MEHTKISEHFDILTWIPNIYIVKAVLLKSSNHYFKMIWVLDSHILLIVIKALIFLLMPLKRHMFEVYPP